MTAATVDRPNATVLLIDDHQLIAEGLAAALRREAIDVEIARVLEPEAVLELIAEWRPAVVLLDLVLGPDVNGLDLIEPALEAGAGAVVILTGVTDPARLGACLEAGAAGVASKAADLREITEGLVRLLDGGRFNPRWRHLELLDAVRRERSDERERLEPFETLTPREQQVLAALMDGRRPQEIAHDFDVKVRTIRSQLAAIRLKLGVRSLIAAVAMAVEAGWSIDRPTASPLDTHAR